MAIDYTGFLYGKGQPRAIERHTKRVDAEKALKEAYAEVDKRDGGRCRVTGKRTEPGHVDPRRRREHHHLIPRSRDKGLVADSANIVTVTAEAHALIESGWLVSEGLNAEGVVRWHWAAHVKPEQKPFRIASRRRSQAA